LTSQVGAYVNICLAVLAQKAKKPGFSPESMALTRDFGEKPGFCVSQRLKFFKQY
jgi:hypothetical protein